MIYIISEDKYFSLGLMLMLSQAEYSSKIISYDELHELKKTLCENDTLLVCVQNADDILLLKDMAKQTSGKIIFFAEVSPARLILNSFCHGVISKKSHYEEVCSAIKKMHE